MLTCVRSGVGGCVRKPSDNNFVRLNYAGAGSPKDAHYTETELLMQQWAEVSPGKGNSDANQKYAIEGRCFGSRERQATNSQVPKVRPEIKLFLAVLVAAACGVLIGSWFRQTAVAALAESHSSSPALRGVGGGRESGHSAGAGASDKSVGPAVEAPAGGAGALLFDCDVGKEDWRHKWTVLQMDWCCSKVRRGCRDGAGHSHSEAPKFRCDAKTTASWPEEEVSWCCTNLGIGCRVRASSTADELPHFNCSDVPPGGKSAWPAKKMSYCLGGESIDCDKGDDHMEGWSPHKKAWCCEFKQKGCVSDDGDADVVAYVDDAGDDVSTHSQTTTLPEAKADEHNCGRDLNKWMTAWTPSKKAWCCQHRHIGCPPVPDAALAKPSEAGARL